MCVVRHSFYGSKNIYRQYMTKFIQMRQSNKIHITYLMYMFIYLWFSLHRTSPETQYLFRNKKTNDLHGSCILLIYIFKTE